MEKERCPSLLSPEYCQGWGEGMRRGLSDGLLLINKKRTAGKARQGTTRVTSMTNWPRTANTRRL